MCMLDTINFKLLKKLVMKIKKKSKNNLLQDNIYIYIYKRNITHIYMYFNIKIYIAI